MTCSSAKKGIDEVHKNIMNLINQADTLRTIGDLDGAMELCENAVQLSRKLGDKDGLQASLGSQALILKKRGEIDEAMAFHKEEEHICRELGNNDGLQRSLGHQALILEIQGELDGAMALYKEKERICRELGIRYGLAISLINQALNLCRKQSQIKKALSLADEAYCLATDHGYVLLAKRIEGVRSIIAKRKGRKEL